VMTRRRATLVRTLSTGVATGLVLAGCSASDTSGGTPAQPTTSIVTAATADGQAVGPQYDTVHVYVQPGQFDNLVDSWTATFGGTTSAAVVTDVTPTPSQTRSQLVFSPVGTLSVFEFSTPIPFPFGSERTGWLMKDFDAGVSAARAAGASLPVEPFPDPVGRDVVIQFPGGINAQLYWHTTAPSYPPLRTVPDNRVYVSPDAVDAFVKSYAAFTHGAVVSDTPDADGALIGRPGTTFRTLRISSGFGSTAVMVTDGHLPFPYGREVAGYAVADVAATLTKAQSAGAVVLVPPTAAAGTAMLQFPGGYIAEIHQVSP
jgi:hypothetical protein